ncbi:hypothetical protein K461DRAFT_268172 [Myriangium duriaei CBS 260.36]|uniref:Uncharacterized protein n=1 Tax=Myriangium duriaei CBS 260.36 TaxID=1168546 RepID=A0A9P4MJL4_9PEZI|nr:hypothetical protein K461DRAFT_268172 [Myriangium duriaei CBS 260.36]
MMTLLSFLFVTFLFGQALADLAGGVTKNTCVSSDISFLKSASSDSVYFCNYFVAQPRVGSPFIKLDARGTFNACQCIKDQSKPPPAPKVTPLPAGTSIGPEDCIATDVTILHKSFVNVKAFCQFYSANPTAGNEKPPISSLSSSRIRNACHCVVPSLVFSTGPSSSVASISKSARSNSVNTASPTTTIKTNNKATPTSRPDITTFTSSRKLGQTTTTKSSTKVASSISYSKLSTHTSTNKSQSGSTTNRSHITSSSRRISASSSMSATTSAPKTTSPPFVIKVRTSNTTIDGSYLKLWSYGGEWDGAMATSNISAAGLFMMNFTTSSLMEYGGQDVGYTAAMNTPWGNQFIWITSQNPLSYDPAWYAKCNLSSSNLITCTDRDSVSYTPVMDLRLYNLLWMVSTANLTANTVRVSLYADYDLPAEAVPTTISTTHRPQSSTSMTATPTPQIVTPSPRSLPSSAPFGLRINSTNIALNGTYVNLDRSETGYCTATTSNMTVASNFVLTTSDESLISYGGSDACGAGALAVTYDLNAEMIFSYNTSTTGNISTDSTSCSLSSANLLSCVDKDGHSYTPMIKAGSVNSLSWFPTKTPPQGYAVVSLHAVFGILPFTIQMQSNLSTVNNLYISSYGGSQYDELDVFSATSTSTPRNFSMDPDNQHLVENIANPGFIATIVTVGTASPPLVCTAVSTEWKFGLYWALCSMASDGLITCTDQNGKGYIPFTQPNGNSFFLYWVPLGDNAPSSWAPAFMFGAWPGIASGSLAS